MLKLYTFLGSEMSVWPLFSTRKEAISSYGTGFWVDFAAILDGLALRKVRNPHSRPSIPIATR